MASLRSLPIVIATSLLALSRAASAEQYVVESGREWSSLASKLKPGDEIVLARGVHVPAAFTGIAGSPFAPIVIRSEAPDQLAEIAADREAIKLVDCRHVRIERIAVRGARRAGVLVESSRPDGSLDIALSDVLVVGAKGLAEESGIVARGVRELGIRRSRFVNCLGCAILIEDCDSVTISDVQVTARTDLAPACGLRLAGRIRSTLVERVTMAGSIALAFDIGRSDSTLYPLEITPAAPAAGDPERTDRPSSTPVNPAGPEALVRFLVISNVRLSRVHRLFNAGSVADSSIRNVTHRDAQEEIYRVSAAPRGRPPVRLRVSDCLFTWSPGSLRRIGVVDENVDAKGLVFGANLWWSSELPAALPLLGTPEATFPGTVELPQILDVEPKFDTRSRVINAEASRFGAEDAS